MSKTITLQDVKERIRKVHGDTITIIDETYTFVTAPARFIDKDYGEFESSPRNVYLGHCCRKRGNANRRVTNLQKYGCEISSQNEDVKQKNRDTCMKNHGVDNYFKLVYRKGVSASREHEARNKAKQTCIERYGVENPFQAEEFKQKSQETLLRNHGVTTPMHSSKIKAKYDWKQIKVREYKTRSKNGTHGTSKKENDFYTKLCELFGHDDIKRFVTINSWSIDFYVASINTYIQFDGIYWHGLDRPLETIRLYKSKQDRIIEATYLKDIEQVRWFETHELKLVRVTDKEFKEWERNKTAQSNLQRILISAKS